MSAGSTERAGRVLARHVDVVVLKVVRVREEHRVGGAVEEEAQALGQVAQVGGLAPDEQVEQRAVELRVAHPLGSNVALRLEVAPRVLVTPHRHLVVLPAQPRLHDLGIIQHQQITRTKQALQL